MKNGFFKTMNIKWANFQCDNPVITQRGATHKTLHLLLIAKTTCCHIASLLSRLADSTRLVFNDLPVYKEAVPYVKYFPCRNIKPFTQLIGLHSDSNLVRIISVKKFIQNKYITKNTWFESTLYFWNGRSKTPSLNFRVRFLHIKSKHIF